MTALVGDLNLANKQIDEWWHMGYRKFELTFVENSIIVSAVK